MKFGQVRLPVTERVQGATILGLTVSHFDRSTNPCVISYSERCTKQMM